MVMTFTCNCRLHRRAGWFALRPAILLIVVKVLLIKSQKQRLETYCFCSVSYYYLLLLLFLFLLLLFFSVQSFFPWTMNLSTADLENYWTEFHETWWSYRYMFLVSNFRDVCHFQNGCQITKMGSNNSTLSDIIKILFVGR